MTKFTMSGHFINNEVISEYFMRGFHKMPDQCKKKLRNCLWEEEHEVCS